MSPERSYRRLLRWYPEDWRREHGDVVLGMLLDDAEAHGRERPARGEALHLVIDGIAHHSWRRSDRRRTTAAALVVAAVLALLYAVTVTWSGGPLSEGFLGPFSNPTVLVAVGLAVAAGLAVAGRTAPARLLALACVLGLVVLVAAATTNGWMGPGAPVLAVLGPPALCGAFPSRGVAGVARDAIAALVLATALVLAGIAASYSVVVVAIVAPELVLSFVAPDQRDVELAVLAVLAIPLALAARLPLRRAAPAEPAAAGGSAT